MTPDACGIPFITTNSYIVTGGWSILQEGSVLVVTTTCIRGTFDVDTFDLLLVLQDDDEVADVFFVPVGNLQPVKPEELERTD